MAPAVFGARSAMATYTIGNRGPNSTMISEEQKLRLTNGVNQNVNLMPKNLKFDQKMF